MKNNNNLPFSNSQRQLRIGELLRKEISSILIKYDFHDKFLNKSSVIVSQVVVSPDIKWARTYVTSLGGDNINEVIIDASTAKGQSQPILVHAKADKAKSNKTTAA